MSVNKHVLNMDLLSGISIKYFFPYEIKTCSSNFSNMKQYQLETIIRFKVLIPLVSNMTTSDKNSKSASQWADLLADLFDRLTGKEAEVTYTFDNLEINIPEAVGPDGKTLGSAKWTVNGKVLIKAEAHRTA
jgi:hypothetical protein